MNDRLVIGHGLFKSLNGKDNFLRREITCARLNEKGTLWSLVINLLS